MAVYYRNDVSLRMGSLSLSNTTAVITFDKTFVKSALLRLKGATEPKSKTGKRGFSYIRFKLEGSTALVNMSGKVVLVGAKSPAAIENSTKQLSRLLKSRAIKLSIENFVATAKLNTGVRLDVLYNNSNFIFTEGRVWLEPELFQAFILAVGSRSITLFPTGKYIITGCRTCADLKSFQKFFEYFLLRFQKKLHLPPINQNINDSSGLRYRTDGAKLMKDVVIR